MLNAIQQVMAQPSGVPNGEQIVRSDPAGSEQVLCKALPEVGTDTLVPELANAVDLIHLEDVCRTIGYSKSSIYNKLNPRSKYFDPSFPTPIKMEPDSGSKYGAVRWVRGEVLHWVIVKISGSRKSNPENIRGGERVQVGGEK